jgi:hypothetical protein
MKGIDRLSVQIVLAKKTNFVHAQQPHTCCAVDHSCVQASSTWLWLTGMSCGDVPSNRCSREHSCTNKEQAPASSHELLLLLLLLLLPRPTIMCCLIQSTVKAGPHA